MYTSEQLKKLQDFQKAAVEMIKAYRQPKKLLSKGNTNAKTTKNALNTFILYLLPWKYNVKGVNLCARASVGCSLGCLVFAGRGVFDNVKKARLFKTHFYLTARASFLGLLAKEIKTKIKTGIKRGEITAFRLNGTSDIDLVHLLKKYEGLNIEDYKDTAVFYDYTAILGKALKYKNHPNYHITFSRKEDNEQEVIKALKEGINVSVVFNGFLPLTYHGFKVVDGDKTDIEMMKYKGVVLGLQAKGSAKKDKSGFVLSQYVSNEDSFIGFENEAGEIKKVA